MSAGPQPAVTPPPDFGSGPGVRARVREYRLAQVRRVMAAAKGPLRFEDVHERLVALDGVGIPMRTLKEPPLSDLVSQQTPRKGRLGELAGLPWLLRRLTPERLDARRLDLEGRLRAMCVDLPAPPVDVAPGDGERARIQYVWDLEKAIRLDADEHALAIAARMVAQFVARRDAVVERREAALSAAYRELRLPSHPGPNC